jgi:hypothetical protein
MTMYWTYEEKKKGHESWLLKVVERDKRMFFFVRNLYEKKSSTTLVWIS